MREAYLVDAVRSPIGVGKPEKGWLYPVAPVDLLAHVLTALVRRTGIDPRQVEDVIVGCVTPVGDQGANIARLGLLQAGFPYIIPGVQLNRMCGSGQQSVHFAAQAILAGTMDLVIAGGLEMMSHQPLGSDYPEAWPENFPYRLVHQGISAEMMAEKWGLSRESLDDYAFHSHLRAGEAIREGRQTHQIEPVPLPGREGDQQLVKHDQGVRQKPDREKMGHLPAVFKEGGVITAGNSSQISDGAAVLLVASEEGLKRHNLDPMARVVAMEVVGSDPVLMLDGPIHATRRILSRAEMDLDQMDLIELNEAFASVVLAWAEELHPDMDRLNPDGGAIAHGHPLGATGAILMTKLLHELEREGGRFGLQAMCIGHGMATATILERP
jgi:acetyl-CoA acetyltransferase family protein